jgi:hypothetical protein
MTIASYTDLLNRVESLTDRDDLDTHFPTFVQLTEARLNRLLEDPEMEVTSTATASGDSTLLPADFGSMVSVSTGDGRLAATGPVEFAAYDSTVTGTPRHYVIRDGAISFWPGNGTAIITMVYRRRLPPLTAAAPSNWLLLLAPDLYLYGVLMQAYLWDHDEDRAGAYKSAMDEATAELRQDGNRRKWGAGPIAPRIRRP